jgi:hypothetical protein
MKIKFFVLVSIFFLSSFKSNRNEQLDFDYAISYLSKIDHDASEIAKRYNLKKSEILPIVFPECSRFSSISNALEKSILHYFYIENGKEAANFSIGYFQMKPSFIEELEEIIANKQEFEKHKKLFSYKSKEIKEIRQERLTRLMSEKWQIEYLCAFVKHMKSRYIEEKLTCGELSFFASAYNYGFQASSEEIIKWIGVKAFPNGIKNQVQNYAYAELANDYKSKFYAHEN